jgi:threonine dehydrogenase-like Zn-dependent dehydrogenase
VKALVLEGDRVALAERPAPVAPPGEVVVRVVLAGICGTDLELAKGYMGFRGVLGHELLGRVEGRRFVVEINAACGACPWCRRGQRGHCPHRTVLGILGRDGAFAEAVAVPAANLHEVPDSVPDEHAVFVEPIAAALHVLDEVKPGSRDHVAVVGDGRLGLLCALALRSAGVSVQVVGHHEGHLALAEASGAAGVLERDLAPSARKSFDVVVDATGSPAGLARSLELVRPRGTLVLKSTFAARAGVDLAPIVIDEVNVVGSRCGPFPRAIAALAERAIDPRPLIEARYPLARGEEALAHSARPGALKVLIAP